MDLILDILIPKNKLDRLKLTELFVEWGDEKFSQDPKRYRFQSTVLFYENNEISYYQDIIEDELDIYDYIALTLDGKSLSELENMVNNKEFRKDRNELISLFYEMYNSLNTFAIIKFLNEEYIDNKYIVTNADDAIDIFIDSLKWDSPKGIVIIKKPITNKNILSKGI